MPRLSPQTYLSALSLGQGHASSLRLVLPPRQACLVPLPSTSLAQVHAPFQPLTGGHPAIALETDALVLVTLDPSGLVRRAILGVDSHAGVALGAAERGWVRCWQEKADAHPGNGSQVR